MKHHITMYCELRQIISIYRSEYFIKVTTVESFVNLNVRKSNSRIVIIEGIISFLIQIANSGSIMPGPKLYVIIKG